MGAARITAVTPKPTKKARNRSGLNRPMGGSFHIEFRVMHQAVLRSDLPSSECSVGIRSYRHQVPMAKGGSSHSVAKVAHPGKDHRDPRLVGTGDDLVVAQRPA